MTYKTYITAALVAATGLAFALPVLAQSAAPAAPMARPALFDFATLDANGDGKVTMEEITAARDAEAKALDANGDGKIDAAELLAYRTAQIEARVKAEFAALDTDGDGALSAAEVASHRIVRATPALPQAMFDRLDTDKDGAISQAEFDAAKALVQNRGKNMRSNNDRGYTMQGNTRNQRGDRMQGQDRGNMRGNKQGGDQNTGRGWLPFWRH